MPMKEQNSAAPRTCGDSKHTEQKSFHYSLLARTLNYPDAELCGMLRDGSLPDALLRTFEQVTGKAPSETLQALSSECAAAVKGDEAEVLLDLERDYTRLFFASKPRLAYLFESVYKEGRLMQESTFEVARLYRDAGLVLSEEFRLPVDHIAVELEFLSFLFLKETEAIQSADQDNVAYARELRCVLLTKHLTAFAAALAGRVAKHARHPLYKLAAAMLAEHFATDATVESKDREVRG